MNEQVTPQEAPTEAQPSTITGPISPYTPPSHGKRIVFILLILLVISGGLVAGTMYFAQVKSLPILGSLSHASLTPAKRAASENPLASQAALSSAWKSASNSYCAATLSYPPEWVVTQNETSNSRCVIEVDQSKEKAAGKFIFTGLKLDGGIEGLVKGLGQTTPIKFAGMDAYRYVPPLPTTSQSRANVTAIIGYKNGMIYNATLLNYSKQTNIQEVLDEMAQKVIIDDRPQAVEITPIADQFALSHNSARERYVLEILNAVGQYAAENRGVLPPGIPGVPTEIAKDGYDLCHYIYPDYIAQLPQDPLVGNGILTCSEAYKTGFMISKSSRDEITISAPRAELGKTISVIR